MDDERARNAALEDSYAQLLRQVQQLQNTHLLDLRSSEQRFHNASAALQKALVSKSEELVGLSNKLASSDARYERDSREWHKERVSLLAQVETLSTASAGQINKIADREKRLMEMNKLRKELAERIALREQDLIKYGKALRNREAEFVSEKDMRMKLEAKVHNLEQHQSERDNQFREIQTQLHRKILETEELAGLKIVFHEAKRDIEDFTRREKYYNTEIEQMANRERKLFIQVEQLTAAEKNNTQELRKLGDRQAALVKDLEERQIREERLSRELHESQSRTIKQEGEFVKLEKQFRQAQLDTNRLMQEYSNMQTSLEDTKAANQSLNQELLIWKNKDDLLEKEVEDSLAKITVLSKDLGSKERECEAQKEEIRMLSEKLDHEKQHQNDLRLQSKEKFALVTTKITELQETLTETQTQLNELRSNEKNMRTSLRQKEESMKTQSQVLSEAEAKIQELLSSSAKEAIEFEQFKNRKRDEILAIQDKYTLAKQSMDTEVTQLRHQLQQKHMHYSSLSDEFGELKIVVSELAAIKLSLENKLAELSSVESSQQRQIASLHASISQKNQEISRLATKHVTLSDQTKRLDEELNLYRENTSTARDADINRLQNNMEEISKRLKNQVDVLLDKDVDTSLTHTRTLSSSSGSPARQPSASPSRYVTAPSVSAKQYQNSALTSINDEFDNLDKLLNRSKLSSSELK